MLFCELENDHMEPKIFAFLTWPKNFCYVTGCIIFTTQCPVKYEEGAAKSLTPDKLFKKTRDFEGCTLCA